MKSLRLAAATAAISLAAFTAAALGHQGTKLVSGYVNLNDSANVYRALYDNTPIEPEFKLAPKFAVVGIDNRFVFSMGASMKFTTSFDWGNPVSDPKGMDPSCIKPPLTSDNHLYQMSAGGSGIYFNIIGFPNTANEIGLFISVGLDSESNNSYKLSAGQVYMRYREFQCGYSTSLYTDRSATPYTIDSNGPCASGSYSTVGMNWQHFFNSHVRLGLGVELPEASYTQIEPTEPNLAATAEKYRLASNQYLPDFPLYVGYAWRGGHARLSTIIRSIHYTDLLTGRGHTCFGNGLQLTGSAAAGPVNLYWMAQMGWASAGTFAGNGSAALDLVPDQDRPGMLKPTRSWGFITGVQWNINPGLFATLQQSYMRNYIPGYTISAQTPYADQMRRGHTAVANVVWKISSLFSTGIEYKWAMRTDESGRSLSNNRVYAMLLMNF